MLALQPELSKFQLQLFPVLWTQSQNWFKEVQPRRVVNTWKMLPPWFYISKSRYSEIYSTALYHHGIGSLCRSGCCYVRFFVFLFRLCDMMRLYSQPVVWDVTLYCVISDSLLLRFKQYSTVSSKVSQYVMFCCRMKQLFRSKPCTALPNQMLAVQLCS